MQSKIIFRAIGAATMPMLLASCDICRDKPNVVFVFADDLGQECLDVYGGTYGTPSLNSLSEESIVFTNMHSLPLSCPSRVQLMTGQYSYKNYVAFGYINPDENTFAHLAKKAGYSTAMIGKWQLGRSREIPEKLGFDYWCLNQVEMYKEFAPKTMGKYTDRYANSYVDNMGHYELSLYGPDLFQQYAYEYIEDCVSERKPFMLYYSLPLVHTPHTPTPDSQSWDLDYDSRFVDDPDNFGDMVRYMDKQVGELVQKLKDEGVWDNTILIFTADNGTSTRIISKMQDGSYIQGGKGTTLDTGTKVPLIISWGKRIKAKQVNERLVDLVDFMPTFADIMGVDVPDEWDTDGISLYPDLIGNKSQRDYTICHFNPLWPTTKSPLAARCARTDRYKLYDDGRFFDVKSDPMQKSNIITGTPEEEDIRTYLQSRLDMLPAWSPDKCNVKRRGDYGTFYDFADPQNPF